MPKKSEDNKGKAGEDKKGGDKKKDDNGGNKKTEAVATVAGDDPNGNPVLFESSVSMKFFEIKKATVLEKVINVFNVLKLMFGILEDIPLIGTLMQILQTVLQLLSSFLRLFADPLHILLEAHDKAGAITYYMIKDGRNVFYRAMGFGKLSNMQLTRIEDMWGDKHILTTKRHLVFDCCCLSGCCCVPVRCCSRVKQLELRSTDSGNLLHATRQYKRCRFSCTTTIYLGDSRERTIEFRKKCCARYVCGKIKNTIKPATNGGTNTKEKTMEVTPNLGFALSDFLMSIEELESETEDLDIVEAGLGAVGTVQEVKKNMEELMENMEQLKKKGFYKIHTSRSKWEIEFPENFTAEEKRATLLFVWEQYALRL